jgi:hypothetical protein
MRTHLKQPLCLRERLLGRDVAILHTGTTTLIAWQQPARAQER